MFWIRYSESYNMRNPIRRNPEKLIQESLNLGFTSSKVDLLSKSDDYRAVEPLVEGLLLERFIISDQIRKRAIRGLSILKRRGSINELLKWLGNNDLDNDGFGIRLEAAKLLTELGEPQWQRIILGDDLDFERLGSSEDPRAIIPLVDAACRVQSVRRAKKILLKKMGDTNATNVLLPYCLDWAPSVRLTAAHILTNWGEPEFGKIISGKDGDFKNLGKSGDKRLFGPMIKSLQAINGKRSQQPLKLPGCRRRSGTTINPVHPPIVISTGSNIRLAVSAWRYHKN